MRIVLGIAALSLMVLGCGCELPRIDARGAEHYSLGGKAIVSPNQVEIVNPYDFETEVTNEYLENGSMRIHPHSAEVLTFVGQKSLCEVVVKRVVAGRSATQPTTLPTALTYEKKQDLSTGRTIYLIR